MRSWITFLTTTGLVTAVAVLMIAAMQGTNAMGQIQTNHVHVAAKSKTPKFTNKLVHETSPYLLQHAHNPVNWFPWGDKAFNASRQTGKPIFLSVGYSTCYWCHVMERQCFEDEEIAKQMNAQFICVKVDREERPDIDNIYMAATQMISGGGGWPMSVFLTPPGANGPKDPGLKPFYAGTYFPPVGQYGRPGFPQIMEGITNAWTTRRKDILKSADDIATAIQTHLGQLERKGDLSIGLVQTTTTQLLRSYDPTYGGFGNAPKFPTPNNLMLLFAVYQNSGDQDILDAVDHTLERMARGGIYDQIGGGFHRYSTDDKWLVPHFEKMLYDNGQLIEAYLTAHATCPKTKDPQFFARVVRETCDYILREMTDSTGTFWSAQDAEVDAREGLNYLWTPQQIQKAVGDGKLAALATQLYGLDEGTNFQDPHHRDEPPANVLYLPLRLDELALLRNTSLEELLAARQVINQKMYPVRMQRKQPATDDKIIVSWNGIMVGALAMAGRQLEEPSYTNAAIRAARYILENMRQEDGGLNRTMRKGRVKINAFLDDYAFLVHGLLEIYRTNHDQYWLDTAKDLITVARERFSTPDGGYYDTLADQPDLFVRTRNTHDGAIPTGNSQMIHNLIDLYELTDNEEHLDLAVKDLQSFAGVLTDRGYVLAHMQHALLRAIKADPKQIGNMEETVATPTDNAPVSIMVETNSHNLNDDTPFRITLNIQDGFHINANDPGMDNLIATSISLTGTDGVKLEVAYPSGESRTYPYSDEPINVYEGHIAIDVQTIKTGEISSTGSPKLTLTYQACTDQACLLPTTVGIPIQIRLADD